MPTYTEADLSRARSICTEVINRIADAHSAEQVDEKGWLALGHIQALYAMETLSANEHCQLIKDLACMEVHCIARLRSTR